MGIRSWIKNWISEENLRIDTSIRDPSVYSISSTQRLEHDRAIRLTIYSAAGGRIVETNRYESVKDRNHSNLYIITSDQDFGKEIEKILTMENLRS